MIHLQFVDETRTNLLRTTTVWKGFIVISIRSVKMAAMEPNKNRAVTVSCVSVKLVESMLVNMKKSQLVLAHSPNSA
jgi:hypothetical protein